MIAMTRRGCFDPASGAYRPVPMLNPELAPVANYKKAHGVVRRIRARRLVDLGDGVAGIRAALEDECAGRGHR